MQIGRGSKFEWRLVNPNPNPSPNLNPSPSPKPSPSPNPNPSPSPKRSPNPNQANALLWSPEAQAFDPSRLGLRSNPKP